MIHFTEIDRLPAYDVKGHYLGRIVDLGIEPSQDPLRIAMYFLRTPSRQSLCIPHEQMQSVSVRAAQARVPVEGIQDHPPEGGVIRIRKDVLDQQIIDNHEQKVIRVNDVAFEIQPSDQHADLRIVAVDPSWSAAVRRLLQGLLAKHRIRRIANLFPSRAIPWEFVNLIEPDPARRLKLRLSYERLAKIHPANLADILQELSLGEQRSVVEALDKETAAHAVSEIPTHLQAALIESISSDKAADIVEAMPPDEAADVLQELPPEASAAVLASMERKEAEDVRELLGFETNTAGGLMTTDFVSVPEDARVSDAVSALRATDAPIESVHAVHLVNHDGQLRGVVSLLRLVLAGPSDGLRELSEPLVSTSVHTGSDDVLDLFDRYGLIALPVLDDHETLVGVVTVDDVLKLSRRDR